MRNEKIHSICRAISELTEEDFEEERLSISYFSEAIFPFHPDLTRRNLSIAKHKSDIISLLKELKHRIDQE